MYSRLERLQRPTFYIFSAKLAKLINIKKKIVTLCYINVTFFLTPRYLNLPICFKTHE